MSEATARDIHRSKAHMFCPGRLTCKTISGRPSMPMRIPYARRCALRRPKETWRLPRSQEGHDSSLAIHAPLHVMERVVAFLFPKGGKEPCGAERLGGRGNPRYIGGAAWPDLDHNGQPRVTGIASEVSCGTVDASVALGTWFAQNFKITVNAKLVVKEFWNRPAELARIPPASVGSVARIVSPLGCTARQSAGNLEEHCSSVAVQDLRAESVHDRQRGQRCTTPGKCGLRTLKRFWVLPRWFLYK